MKQQRNFRWNAFSESMSRRQSLPHDNSIPAHWHRAHSWAKPWIIYFRFIRNYLNVEYTSCHREILFDLSFEKGRRGHYHRRNVLGRTRSSQKAYLHTSPINFLGMPRGPDGRRSTWRMDNRNVFAQGREITSNIRSASRSPILDRAPICRWQVPRSLHACVAVCVSFRRHTSPGRQCCKCGSPHDNSRKWTASSWTEETLLWMENEDVITKTMRH